MLTLCALRIQYSTGSVGGLPNTGFFANAYIGTVAARLKNVSSYAVYAASPSATLSGAPAPRSSPKLKTGRRSTSWSPRLIRVAHRNLPPLVPCAQL